MGFPNLASVSKKDTKLGIILAIYGVSLVLLRTTTRDKVEMRPYLVHIYVHYVSYLV